MAQARKRDPNTSNVCRTCGKPLSEPWRSRDADGKIWLGCVDSDHEGHLYRYDDLRWHKRPEARKARLNVDRVGPL